MTEAAGIPLKLRRLSGEKALTDDIEAQLNDLFRKDFLTTVPLSQLAHYPRYLRAVHYRLDRYRDDPVRDESRRADIERLSVPLMRLVRRVADSPTLVLMNSDGCCRSSASRFSPSSCDADASECQASRARVDVDHETMTLDDVLQKQVLTIFSRVRCRVS